MKIPTKTEKVALILRTAGDESRLKLMCALFSDADICVSELALKLNMRVAIASHHLRALAKVGLLSPVRKGKNTCYKPADTRLAADLKNFICKYK